MKNLFAIISFAVSLNLSAQEKKFHTPAEMLKIGIESKLSYNISILDKPLIGEINSDNLNLPDYYRVEENNNLIIRKYNIQGKAQTFFENAENNFKEKKLKQALENYQLAYKEDPNFALALTYAGQVCEHEGNYSEAESLLKKAISQNYIDYLAHWFLANVYEHNGELQKAKSEILIAHILNRNNPRIISTLTSILLKTGKQYNNKWHFNPQVVITKSDTGINVQYDGIWLGYALAKALWQYEPGYKESMGVTKDANIEFNQDAEKEGLVSLLVTAENDKKKDLPESIKALQFAVKNEMFQAYLFYEIWLPKRPDVAYQLPEKFINEISDYILKVRCVIN